VFYVKGVRRLGGLLSLSVALGAMTVGCGADFESAEESAEDSERVDGYAEGDEQLAADETLAEEGSELGTAQQALLFSSFFDKSSFQSSCSDPNGTNSVLAALAVATATELQRWQPRTDFEEFLGVYRLTSTGKAQCADGRCWNTQAVLDLQKAPSRRVQIRPGVYLDTGALRSAINSADRSQLLSGFLSSVPAHKFQLMSSAPGGCDTMYWFNVTTPTGGNVLSSVLSGLQKNLEWVGGAGNPYIQFQTNGTTVGIDPTYGMNQVGSTSTASCAAACTKMSSTDITGSCCSCNGTKKYARSAWSTTTYICQ
jgi:hypothetical protein